MPVTAKTPLFHVQGINLEHIPERFVTDKFLDELTKNGGNIVDVDSRSSFGKWLLKHGYIMSHSAGDWHWDHFAVFR